MKPLIIYHGNCIDGSSAAVCAYLKLGKEADYLPAVHGKTEKDFNFLICENRDVYFLDFCFSRETMEKIKGVANKFIILDHHKTSRDNLEGLNFEGKFNMEKSGAMLAYEWFKPENVNIEVIKRIQDRDLWKKEFNDSDLITAFFFCLEPFEVKNEQSVSDWLYYIDEAIEFIQIHGEVLLKQRKKDIRLALEKSYKVSMFGCEVWVANVTNCFSEVAGELAKRGKFGVAYQINGDEEYVYSLRSEGDVDVSALAKNMGGGGHKNASAFISKTPIHTKL